MSADFQTDLKLRIRAGYPALYITAREDLRCVEAIRKVASEIKDITFAMWTPSLGIIKEYEKAMGSVMKSSFKPDKQDPAEAIQYALGKNNLVFALVNFHRYMDDPQMIAAIKDIVFSAKSLGTTVIFVCNILKIPAELQDDLTVLDFPLPDTALLKERVNYIAEDKLTDIPYDAITDAALGMTTWEAENAMAMSIAKQNTIDPKLIAKEKAKAVAKTGVLEFYEPNPEGLKAIGGLDNLKGWLYQRKGLFTKAAREYGLPEPKGILIVGVPGTGKSLAAKCVATEWGIPLLRFDVGKVFQGLVGASESNMRSALSTAEAVSPCVLWMDELEKGMAGAGGSGSTDSGVTARVFGSFISWMQDKKRPVFIMATANKVESLPPELLRAGRFDEVFAVDLPNEEERIAILTIHLTRTKRDISIFDIKHLAGISSMFSGAELEQVIYKAMIKAYSDSGREFTTEDIGDAITATVPLAVTRKEDIDEIRKWSQSRAVPASSKEPPEIKMDDIRPKRRIIMDVREQDIE